MAGGNPARRGNRRKIEAQAGEGEGNCPISTPKIKKISGGDGYHIKHLTPTGIVNFNPQCQITSDLGLVSGQILIITFLIRSEESA